jgi:hypothetical protein
VGDYITFSTAVTFQAIAIQRMLENAYFHSNRMNGDFAEKRASGSFNHGSGNSSGSDVQQTADSSYNLPPHWSKIMRIGGFKSASASDGILRLFVSISGVESFLIPQHRGKEGAKRSLEESAFRQPLSRESEARVMQRQQNFVGLGR